MSKITATWNISLNCDCPKCGHEFDMLDDVEFFDGNNIQVGEHETSRTTDMEASCPKCGHDFLVDLAF
jgi:predicted RNA-binding Zn-ribbon protein involved in translation (DUF1610 family)